jgi:hypothetical protein
MSDVARDRADEAESEAFWREDDFEALVARARPYEGPDEFAIDDLTDDEWDRFVAALNE